MQYPLQPSPLRDAVRHRPATIAASTSPALWSLVLLASCGCGGSEGGRTRTLDVTESGVEVALELHAGDDAHADGSLTLALPGSGLAPSPLGLRTDRGDFRSGLRLLATAHADVDDTYTMPTGKRRTRTYHHAESTFTFENPDGERMQLVVRTTPEGLAFRYRLLGTGMVTVLEETTMFVPEADRAYLQPYDAGGLLGFGAYEQLPFAMDTGTGTLSTGWALPALFRTDATTPRYLFVAESDLDGSYAGTRLHNEEGIARYGLIFPGENEAQGVGASLPTSPLPLETPWRVLVVGDAATVIENTLVDDLADPSIVSDPSWIRPGVAAWSWASQLTGTPALQAEYVATAGAFAWEHVIVDARWDQWPNVSTELDALVAAGDTAGVGIWLWYNSGGAHNIWTTETPFDRMLDPLVREAEMSSLEAGGIAGIKVDFFESDKQDRIQQIHGLLTDAAAHHLMVNLHGCPVPRGWQRTYPHLLTVEAVHGAEFAIGGPSVPPRPVHHVLQAFTRNVIGSMDYTPLNFHAALGSATQPFAHTLALGVIFESGLLSVAERADASPTDGVHGLVAAFPFLGTVLRELPTSWDETRLLSGDPEGHVVIARRAGSTWWIAGITGSTAYTFDADLTTALGLASTDYTLEVITAGASDDQLASASTSYAPTEHPALSHALAAEDGFLAILRPAP